MNVEEMKLRCLELAMKQCIHNSEGDIAVDDVIFIADQYYKSLI